LILNAGTTGTAVNKRNGQVVWKSSGEGGYATPVPMGGNVLIFGTKSLAAVAVKSGAAEWEFPWKTLYDVNAADPVIVSSNKVLISSDYNHGSALLELKSGSAMALWQNQNMKNPFASSILLDGFVYGIDAYAGKPNGTLRCIDVQTGELKWSEASIGNGALMAAEGKLIIMSEHGELVIAQAASSKFKPLARFQVLGGRCWTVPVLSNGKIFARNARGELVRLDASGR
jgi:outer membrane protein assembly factor BamB